jgi:endonuclease-3
MVRKSSFQQIIDKLEARYGPPAPPNFTEPFEMLLYESVAYLASDEKRDAAFATLQARIGTAPTDILGATEEALISVTRTGGIVPEMRARRLKEIALIALQEFHGEWNTILKQPFKQARKALMKFPSIGEPGAEKILLFSRNHQVLALDSNGLRVLLRLGFGTEQKSYTASYRSAQEAVKDQLECDYSWLIRAHQLLRMHGQQLCRRSAPACIGCPAKKLCQFGREFIE